MRQLIKKFKLATILIVTLLSILFTGCKKDWGDKPVRNYEVRFAINAMSIEKPTEKSKSTLTLDFFESISVNPAEVTHVKVGIDGTFSTPFITETLPYNVNDGVTGAIKLPVGNHNLTSIYLLKEISTDVYEILYSGVAIGAPLSEFVSITLPVSFEIPLLAGKYVNIDVVAIDHWSPEQFGWGMFNVGVTTINEIYFYGAKDDGTQSVMSIDVYRNSTLISSSTQEPDGWIKVLYPDVYSISNSNETLIFNLTKDGVLYSRTFTVEELLALPKEVHLLNVYGSGMFGFEEILVLTSVPFAMPNNYATSGNGERFGFDVINAQGINVYHSDVIQGEKTFQYTNTSTLDNEEFFDIILTYQLFNVGSGQWESITTKSAHVNVATLQAMSSIISMGIYADNYYWLFI